MSETLAKLKTAVIEGQAVPAKEATEAALAEGIPPGRILMEALVPAMDLSLIHISEPTRLGMLSRMPSSA